MDSQARIVTRFQSAIADLNMEERSVAQIRHFIGLGAETVITTLFLNTSARTLSPSFLLTRIYPPPYFYTLWYSVVLCVLCVEKIGPN